MAVEQESSLGSPPGDVDIDAVQRRTVGILSTAGAFGGVAIAGSITAGSLITASIGGEGYAGLAQTCLVLGAAIMALPLARIALVRGRRASLTTGYGIGAAGSLLVVYASVIRNLGLVLLGCLLVGVASASGYQSRYAAVDLAVPERRARALSIVVWAGTIGAVLGPNLVQPAGEVALALGLPQLTGAYLMAGTALLITVVLLSLLLRPDPYLLARSMTESANGEAASHPRLRDGIEHLRAHPKAMFGVAAVSVGHVVMVMLMVMTPVHMAHVDVSLQLIGLVISVHVLGMYALSPVVGWLTDRIGRIPMILVGCAILIASCVLAAISPAANVTLLGFALFLLGLGWSCTLIAGSTLLSDDVEEAERPSVQGLSDLTMNLSGAIGGALAGIIVLVSSYGVLSFTALIAPVLLVLVSRLPAIHRG